MNRTREIRWINAILLLSVSLLLIAIIFTFRTFNYTRASFSQIEQRDSIVNQVSAFESYIYFTESNVRLAIITNSPDVLVLDDYYKEGTNHLDCIKAQATDYSTLVAVDSLKNLLDNWFALCYRIKEVMQDTGNSQYLSVSLAVNGSHLTRHIRNIANDIKENEKRAMRANIMITKNGIMVISTVLTSATVFGLLFIFFSFRRLHVEINKEVDVQVKLQQKIRELDRSNTQLERFAYTASHDLHEPLRKLHAFSEKLVLLEKDKLSADGKNIIDRMQKFVDRMQRLIDDLLLFSRVLSYKLVKAQIDLNKVLAEVKQNMSESLRNTETVINASQLPVIMGYESQLQQLFQNLISNSVRYAKKDVSPVINISSCIVTGERIIGVKPGDENKKFYQVVFSDNGIGFDNKYAERIFEIFQRLHGKSEYEGTGIGLSICKLVAENHDGYIRAEGVEDGGASFIVYFPVV